MQLTMNFMKMLFHILLKSTIITVIGVVCYYIYMYILKG